MKRTSLLLFFTASSLLLFSSCSFKSETDFDKCPVVPKIIAEEQATGVKTLAGHEIRQVIYGAEGDPPHPSPAFHDWPSPANLAVG